MTSAPVRTAVLWVPDWPVVAAMGVAGIDAHLPTAVLSHQGVVAASAVARSAGVRRGMRRRAAQQTCPELVLLPADDARDVREFEPVALAAETVVAGIEVARPGLLLLPADGPARFHGTEEDLARALVEVVSAAGFEPQVGLADGILAAVLAARADALVPPGASRSFLAPRPTSDLVHAVTDPTAVAAVREAVHLWWRLGVRTLGELAALPPEAVTGRFGDLGAWAQRLARGEDLRPPARRRPEEDLAVATELDPPAARVDVATFAARRLADELYETLSRRGLASGRLRITARTEEAELERLWRTDDAAAGGMSAARITDRVRWQLEGWLGDTTRVPAPITHLALAAEEVVPAGTHQPSLWGADAGGDERARRALGRVQGLLGGDAVLTVALQGGREPRDRIHLVPLGEQVPAPRDPALPWPGALPSPAPATVLPDPAPARVLDARGRDVVVDDRLEMSGVPVELISSSCAKSQDPDQPSSLGPATPVASLPPRRMTVGEPPMAGPLTGWAGPWPVEERWWDAGGEGARRVLLQVVVDGGRGLLLAFAGGAWQVEAVYD